MSEWIKQKKFGAFRWRRTLIFIRLFIRHIAWVGIRLDFCCQFGGFTNICSGIGKLCYIDFLFFLGCFLFHYLVQEDSLFSFPFDWIVLRCKTDLCYTIFYTIHSKQIFHNWIYNMWLHAKIFKQKPGWHFRVYIQQMPKFPCTTLEHL